MSRVLAAVVAVSLVLDCPSEVRASSPTERLRGFFASAARALDDPRPEIKPEDRMNAIRTLVRDIFDFREAARLSLGPEWSARTPAERSEFVRLFAELLQRSFISGIAARIRLADGVQVSFIDESVDGTLATVRTAIASKSGLELPFHYRMIERGQRWAVRDVVVDGVSLAANYRAQFGRILQSSSYAGLLRQLRARVPGAGMMTMVAVAEDATPAPPLAPGPSVADSPRPVLSEPVAAPQVQPAPPETETRDTIVPPPAPAHHPKITTALVQSEPTPSRPPAVLAKSWEAEAAVPPPPVHEARLVPDVTPPATDVTPAATKAAASRVPHTRSYWVQVGAFANVAAARRLASALAEQEPASSRGRWVVVVEASADGAPLARVRVGPFTARAEAASRLKDVQARGYQPFISEDRD